MIRFFKWLTSLFTRRKQKLPPQRDVKNPHICCFCKNHETIRLIKNDDYYEKVANHFGHLNFAAWKCPACNANWFMRNS